jgi:sugar/nucleoside kinase (ribokinase family)
MTLGTQGRSCLRRRRVHRVAAFEAPGGCKDTTGAGDAFHSGFLYGLLRGEDVETCLRYGNAVAAMKCSALGARTGLPTQVQFQKFLNL